MLDRVSKRLHAGEPPAWKGGGTLKSIGLPSVARGSDEDHETICTSVSKKYQPPPGATMRSYRASLLASLAGTACSLPPPAQVAPVQIAGSFEKTWAAVIDVFAGRSIPISTIDKSSGLIVSSGMQLTGDMAKDWATCGRGIINLNWAKRADFNVLVRSAGSGSTVRVTARWSQEGYECPTTGAWERGLMLRIKQAVEGPP